MTGVMGWVEGALGHREEAKFHDHAHQVPYLVTARTDTMPIKRIYVLYALAYHVNT
jgi:hypothetical protein